jgi:hypothetical protein
MKPLAPEPLVGAANWPAWLGQIQTREQGMPTGTVKWFKWHCQTKLNRPAKGAGLRRSGRELTPLGQGGGPVLSEYVAAIEVTVLIEMIMDRGVNGGKLLQGVEIPEPSHRSFSSSERLVGILGSIVEPPTALLIGSIADYLHRRSV